MPTVASDFSLKRIKGPEYSINDFDLLETIGTGTMSRVRLVRDIETTGFYAMKMMKKHKIVHHNQVRHVLDEVLILSHLRCKLVVELYAMFQDENNVYIVMEYAPGGELFTHLRRERKFTTDRAKFYAVEVAGALRVMHAVNVLYRDIKPENIVLSADGHIRLCDFGFAKVIKKGNVTFTTCGTPEYITPEMIEGRGYAHAADFWMLGVLLYEMLVGHPPFYGQNPFEVYNKILSGKFSFPMSARVSSLAQLAVHNLLQINRRKRLGCGIGGFSGFKREPFFFGVLWDAVPERLLVPPFTPSVEMDGDSSNYQHYPEEMIEEIGSMNSEQRLLFAEFDTILSRSVLSPEAMEEEEESPI